MIEFKIGGNNFQSSDIDQVWDYTLDLKNFHENSYKAVVTNAELYTEEILMMQYEDKKFRPICTNIESLGLLLRKIINL